MDCSLILWYNLNYAGARAVTYGGGAGPIFLSNVRCKGTELTLADCPHDEPGAWNHCYHREDAGVICQGINTSWKTHFKYKHGASYDSD